MALLRCLFRADEVGSQITTTKYLSRGFSKPMCVGNMTCSSLIELQWRHKACIIHIKGLVLYCSSSIIVPHCLWDQRWLGSLATHAVPRWSLCIAVDMPGTLWTKFSSLWPSCLQWTPTRINWKGGRVSDKLAPPVDFKGLPKWMKYWQRRWKWNSRHIINLSSWREKNVFPQETQTVPPKEIIGAAKLILLIIK